MNQRKKKKKKNPKKVCFQIFKTFCSDYYYFLPYFSIVGLPWAYWNNMPIDTKDSASWQNTTNDMQEKQKNMVSNVLCNQRQR